MSLFETDADFIEAITENPRDDSLRFAYADWLAERGSPRAEFIRIQFRLEKLSAESEIAAALRTRQAELLDQHGEEWADGLRNSALDWKFRRGFVEVVELPVKRYTQIRRLSWLHPIRELRLTGPFSYGKPSVSQIADLPLLQRLDTLEIRNGYYAVSHKGVAALVNSPHLGSLKCLRLLNNVVGVAGAQAIANSPQLANIDSLSLECYGFNASDYVGFAGLRALLDSEHFQRLTEVSLRNCLMNCGCCHLLVEHLPKSKLTRLDLSSNPIADAGATALLEACENSQVRHVRLASTHISKRGLKALRKRFAEIVRF